MREPDFTAYMAPAEAAPVQAANDTLAYPEVHVLQFTGSGGEYFTIWIVNILLTIATCGIYSAWATAQRRRYFARNTVLAGAVFDDDSAPLAILRGRLLAAILIAACLFALVNAPATGLAIALLLAAAAPFALAAALGYRVEHTWYRGQRLRLQASSWDLLRGYLARRTVSPPCYPGLSLNSSLPTSAFLRLLALNAVLTLLSGGLYLPFGTVRAWRFRLAHLSVTTSGSFEHVAVRRNAP